METVILDPFVGHPGLDPLAGACSKIEVASGVAGSIRMLCDGAPQPFLSGS